MRLRSRLLAVFDRLIGIRGYDEDARRLLRRSFCIGYGSIMDLSGKATARAMHQNQRDWDAYWAERYARECPPVDYQQLLREALKQRKEDR